ncbi:hypothetical protein [Ramlibacter albus]|uniref:Uncharacterized protein n=1 Tax=Ramlibacter albus TaxID=2079448 RepID=A0A923S514_9BURK|nr:hypothetical protein [Ramlibacter albus]MBC5768095.1 hypothetical protein [Ramlibacter albus]
MALALRTHELIVVAFEMSSANLLFTVNLWESVAQTLFRRSAGPWSPELAYLEGSIEVNLPGSPMQLQLISGSDAPPLHILLPSLERRVMEAQELPFGASRGKVSNRISELWKKLGESHQASERAPELDALQNCSLAESASSRLCYYKAGDEHLLEIATNAHPFGVVLEVVPPDEFATAIREAYQMLSSRVLFEVERTP